MKIRPKILIVLIIIIAIVAQFTVPVMAAQKLVDITRPEGDEVVTKDIFSICGVCIYDETTIELEYKDRDTGEYKPLLTTEGKSTFKVPNKIFGKDVQLKYKGDNFIKITAHAKPSGEEKSISEEKRYTITLGEEKKKSNWFKETTDAIADWLLN